MESLIVELGWNGILKRDPIRIHRVGRIVEKRDKREEFMVLVNITQKMLEIEIKFYRMIMFLLFVEWE
jgi:hypothetical protein